MIRRIILGVLLLTISTTTFAKKDINAWKKETNLEDQFSVFKKNLNLWDGYLFFKEPQIDELFRAVNDSIANLENTISENKNTIGGLNAEIENLNTELTNTKQSLEESQTREDSFSTMGLQISKGSFATVMYVISGLLLLTVGILFFLYKQSHQITKEAKEKFEDLDKEFEQHKKNNLERFTKLNRELHDARMKLGEL